MNDLGIAIKNIADLWTTPKDIAVWSVDSQQRHCSLICGRLPNTLLTILCMPPKHCWLIYGYPSKTLLTDLWIATKDIAYWSVGGYQIHYWLICGSPPNTLLNDHWIAIKDNADWSVASYPKKKLNDRWASSLANLWLATKPLLTDLWWATKTLLTDLWWPLKHCWLICG